MHACIMHLVPILPFLSRNALLGDGVTYLHGASINQNNQMEPKAHLSR